MDKPTLDDAPVADDDTPDEDTVEPEPGDNKPAEEWAEPDSDWPHEWIEFKGDKLAVRKPTQQAFAAYSLSASQFVNPQMQNDISGLFMMQHISPASYLRVM